VRAKGITFQTTVRREPGPETAPSISCSRRPDVAVPATACLPGRTRTCRSGVPGAQDRDSARGPSSSHSAGANRRPRTPRCRPRSPQHLRSGGLATMRARTAGFARCVLQKGRAGSRARRPRRWQFVVGVRQCSGANPSVERKHTHVRLGTPGFAFPDERSRWSRSVKRPAPLDTILRVIRSSEWPRGCAGTGIGAAWPLPGPDAPQITGAAVSGPLNVCGLGGAGIVRWNRARRRRRRRAQGPSLSHRCGMCREMRRQDGL
jgi:hypothetical protein